MLQSSSSSQQYGRLANSDGDASDTDTGSVQDSDDDESLMNDDGGSTSTCTWTWPELQREWATRRVPWRTFEPCVESYRFRSPYVDANVAELRRVLAHVRDTGDACGDDLAFSLDAIVDGNEAQAQGQALLVTRLSLNAVRHLMLRCAHAQYMYESLAPSVEFNPVSDARARRVVASASSSAASSIVPCRLATWIDTTQTASRQLLACSDEFVDSELHEWCSNDDTRLVLARAHDAVIAASKAVADLARTLGARLIVDTD